MKLAWFITSTLAVTAPASNEAPGPSDAYLSNDYIVMNKDGSLSVYGEDSPADPARYTPNYTAYEMYKSLVGTLTPGERKRLPKTVSPYLVDEAGSYVRLEWATCPDNRCTPEPNPIVIRKSDPQYRCYERILPKPAHRAQLFLTQEQQDKLHRCFQTLDR